MSSSPRSGSGSTGGEGRGSLIPVEPTRYQRQWWVPFVFLGPLAVIAAVAFAPGLEHDEVPTLLVGCGLLAGIGAFLSGGLLRQRQAAEATSISVSDDGTLRLRDASGEVACRLEDVRGVAVRHGQSVRRLYGAEMPPSLAGSGPRAAVVLDFDDRTETFGFTGQLPADGQRRLLEAAGPFLASGRAVAEPVPTPDERYAASSSASRAIGLGGLIVMVLVLLIPALGLMAAQIAFRGDLDPNSRWLAILLWIASGVVIVVGAVRLIRKR